MSEFIVERALDLPLRGERSYAHGTDMYVAAAEAAAALGGPENIADFRLSFHGLLQRQGRLTLFEAASAPKEAKAPVEFSFRVDDRRLVGRILPGHGTLERRVPWDEGEIEKRCVIVGDTVRVKAVAGQRPIERLVAATKVLHNGLFPAPGMRWMFTRIELPGLLPAAPEAEIAVFCRHNFNNRLTRSDVELAGRPHGQIFFSLMPR